MVSVYPKHGALSVFEVGTMGGGSVLARLHTLHCYSLDDVC
ncbi:hypothetical protein SBF1_3460004 [Candidatus Desulfosporosinus infrequens]|uniref:Uncharacterized protein n=1 Tax=Candidatus Desulfosporosinus infrequens TaxID=2043169 RepID=A0A2U3L2X4_9FIRM|nr:hypothetical protein SBF1_3460004 [Candidatus Desulfosporosinus infrequens]